MTSRRALLLGLASFAVAGLSAPSHGQAPTPRPAPDPVPGTASAVAAPANAPLVTHGRVIILRGYLNIFSRGMDVLSQKLTALGIPNTLENHSRWRGLADRIVAEYRANPQAVGPIILIGHSLGGGGALVFANYLGLQGVPVRLVVMFDAVQEISPAMPTIAEVINYYKPNGAGKEVLPGKGFTGTIVNVDLSSRRDLGHVKIDKDETLQAEVIAKVFEVYGLESPAPAAPASTAAAGG